MSTDTLERHPKALSAEAAAHPAIRFPVSPGQPIVYYTEAHRGADPRPANCWQRTGRNQISVIEVRHGTNALHSHVRHIDDEYFTLNPAAQHREGAWDYVEVQGPQVAAEQAQAWDREAARIFGDDAITRRVLQYHEEGKTPKQIAMKVASKGVTSERVAAFLAVHNAQPE
jgi:plasmid stabilization system protein ParE